jgi:geranylgeranyl pyrophosphate synthase
MEQVNLLLRHTASRVDEPLRSMLGRTLGGGKQLRPALVIVTGRLFDAPLVPFRRLAAAVDMLHAATLIHDDLVDSSPLRRGQETLHRIWPAGAVVLAGDYLLGEATTLVGELERPRIARVFAGILRTMCAGEIRRMLAVHGGGGASSPEGALRRWREEYYRDIEDKTASLLAATMEMGAILAGADEGQIEMLRRYGQGLGIAFQIMDDVLDVTGDERVLGKPAGSDLRRGLPTLPTLCYLEMTEGGGPVRVVLSGQRDERHVQAALQAIRTSGAIEASLCEASLHARRSQEALASFPDGRWIRILCALADYTVHREA